MSRSIVALLLVLFCCPAAAAEDTARVLIIVGPSNHPPGSHEVAAGGRLMQHCLDHAKNVPGLTTDIVYRWPEKDVRAAASTVVFIGDTFPPNRFSNPKQKLAELDEMMQRGCGIVCVHYATGLWGEDVMEDGDHPLLRWLGGYFANRTCPHHESIARIYRDARITPASPDHPISHGWKPFTLHDEPYINNYFGKDDNKLAANVTTLATSMLPPEKPMHETVAWCVDRKDGGRGFGIVMPHFYKNWANQDLRKFILNGIVWSAKLDVPKEGVISTLPELSKFKPDSIEYVPR